MIERAGGEEKFHVSRRDRQPVIRLPGVPALPLCLAAPRVMN